ncbi:MAG: hypothetical protein ACYC5J_16055 [Chloroflexota bacterium]
MIPETSRARPGPVYRPTLAHVALAVAVILYAPLYLVALAEAIWPNPDVPSALPLTLLAPVVLISFAFTMPLFSAADAYLWAGVAVAGLLLFALRRGQDFMDMVPCRHTLLGWDSEEVLYYREESMAQPSRIWAFAPGREQQPREVVAAPSDLVADGEQPSVLEWVRSSTSRPEHESNDRRIKLRGSGLRSPSGRWVAAITQWIYGPQDVILLSKNEGGA